MTQDKSPQAYDASSITVLEGLSAVRKRPAMYIGSTDVRGLHHLVYEVVDNSIDEAMAGFCNRIVVVVHLDNSVTVSDNGRGIPVDMHPKEHRPAVEVVMTVLHAGGKFDNVTYKVSGGLHGVGVSVVNALSEYLEVTVRRDGKKYQQRYERGAPVTKLAVIGESDATGTTIRFKPDDEIFETNQFSHETLAKRFEELAYLNKGLEVDFRDERSQERVTYRFDGGLREFVTDLNSGEQAIHDIIEGETELDGVLVDFALQYNANYKEEVLTFANNIRTREGGTHLAGFKTALTRAINAYIEKSDLPQEAQTEADRRRRARRLDRRGLGQAPQSPVRRPDQDQARQFRGGRHRQQGRLRVHQHPFRGKHRKTPRPSWRRPWTRLGPGKRPARPRSWSGARAPCPTIRCPASWPTARARIPKNPSCLSSRVIRPAARPSRGRDPRFQAILPLRGKILNVERTRTDKMLGNKEIRNLITAMWADANHGRRGDRGAGKGKLFSAALP